MKKLKEFIAWVGKQKGFEGMNSDQVITALNEMSSSKEGTAEVAKLMSAFKQDQKIGGASEVLKAKNGTSCQTGKKSLISKHQYGGNFYKNWSKEDIIRLQMFLASEDKLGDERYLGDFDGIVGKETIDAIKAYQRKHGLKHVDGLWGYNTNLIHRPMLSSTLDKGSYKPNQKTDMSSLVPHKTSFTYATADQIPQKELEKAINYYYANPELFFSDDPDASYWRQVFHNSGKWGSDHINMIQTLVDPEKRKNIDSKKQTTQWKTEAVKDAIYEGQKKVMPGLLATLTAPVALGTAVTPILGGAALEGTAGLASSIAGSYILGKLGKDVGASIGEVRAKNPENNTYETSDPMTRRFGGVSIEYDPERTVQEAERIGETSGEILGGIVGGFSGSGAVAKSRAATYNTMGRGRAAMRYKGRPGTLETNVSPYGTATPPKVEGVSNWRLFKKGLTAPRQYADGRLRLGGPHGVRIPNGKNVLNAGSYATPEMVQQTSLRFNNPNSPLNINFGGPQNLRPSVKIGQAYSPNLLGVANITAMETPLGILIEKSIPSQPEKTADVAAEEFDRSKFRERKREARKNNPEWNWRQRRDWALKNIGETEK